MEKKKCFKEKNNFIHIPKGAVEAQNEACQFMGGAINENISNSETL